MKQRYFKLSAISLALLSAQQGVMAQEQEQDLMEDNWGLEEIVVTAQKRSEPLQSTPVAITAISTQDIIKFDIKDAGDLDQLVPALTVTNAADSNSSLLMTIRGVGVDDSQIAVSPAVGTYIDGVYAGQTMGLNAEIVDLENVEVMRGPQGTLYGRNTTGGAINLISAKPSETAGGELTLSAGSYGYNRMRLRVDSGEYGGFSSRLAISQSGKDGWRDNETPGASYDFGSEDKNAARIAFMYNPSDEISLEYAYDYSKQKGPQAYFQLVNANDPTTAEDQWTQIYTGAYLGSGFYSNPADAVIDATKTATELQKQYTSIANEDREDTGEWHSDYPKSETEVQGHNFTASFQINDYLTIKSITGLRKLEEEAFQEYGGGVADLSGLTGGLASGAIDPSTGLPIPLASLATGVYQSLTLADHRQQDHEQISEEIQFVGANESDTLQYVAGLYFYQEDGNEESENIYYHRKIDVDNSTYALFGQATYNPDFMLDGKMGFTLGARYTVDDREFTKEYLPVTFDLTASGKFTSDESYSNFNPNFMLSFQAADDIFTYAKIMTGYKSGGFNARAEAPTTANGNFVPYDEENLVGYELGLKSQWFDRRLRANVAIYQNDYQDMHVSQIPLDTKPWETEIINAADATINGFELDLAAQISDGFVMTAAYAFTKSDFNKVIDLSGVDVSDNWEATFSPENAVTLTAEYRHDISAGEMAYLIAYDWRDEQYTTSDQSNSSADNEGHTIDDFGITNARVSLQKIDMGSGMEGSLSLWVKNLLDEEYVSYQFAGFTQGTLATFGDPRTLGADFTVQF